MGILLLLLLFCWGFFCSVHDFIAHQNTSSFISYQNYCKHSLSQVYAELSEYFPWKKNTISRRRRAAAQCTFVFHAPLCSQHFPPQAGGRSMHLRVPCTYILHYPLGSGRCYITKGDLSHACGQFCFRADFFFPDISNIAHQNTSS